MWDMHENEELRVPEGIQAAEDFIMMGLVPELQGELEDQKIIAVNASGQKWLDSRYMSKIVKQVVAIREVSDRQFQEDFVDRVIVHVLNKSDDELGSDAEHDSLGLLQQSANDVLPHYYDRSPEAHKARDAAKLITNRAIAIRTVEQF